MSDFLDVSFLINYVRETPPESYKLMQVKDKVMATAFENGERTLQAGEGDVQIVSEVNYFYLVSKDPITVSISDGTTFQNMRHFAYGAEKPITVTITNAGPQAVKVLYAAGLALKG